MRITRIIIKNFRSILELDIETSLFNILVGQNNCGKTNLFEAIEFFFNGVRGSLPLQFRYQRQTDNLVSVEVFFEGAQHGVSNMRNEKNKATIAKAIGDADTLSFKRTCSDPNKREMLINGIETKPGTGFDAALNDFLPRFEYVSTKQYYEAVAKFGKATPIGVMLADVISEILQENPVYKEFQQSFENLFRGQESTIKKKFDEVGQEVKEHLSKQFAECSDVGFSVAPPNFEDFLKNIEVGVNDGIYTSAEEKGDGMQRALMLAIISTYADYRKRRAEAEKTFLFFIDEAELHLHPLAQRRLKDVLHGLSTKGDQVFINTHSSVFVADDYENQKLYKVEKVEGATTVEEIEEDQKPYVVYELLGGSPSDLLLPRNFLIVEGESEFEFFTRVVKRFYSDKPSIQIIKARGDLDQTDRLINALEKTLTPLADSFYKKALVVLVDKPHDSKEQGLKDLLKRHAWLKEDERFFKMPFRDLEQYYPDQPCPTYTNWKKTQDDIDAKNAKDETIFTGHKKKQLAKHVGDNISQHQFETEMAVCYSALQGCWDGCYN